MLYFNGRRKRNKRKKQHRLNDGALQNLVNQVSQTKITTEVEITEPTSKLLKTLVFTISGAVILSAVIRSRTGK